MNELKEQGIVISTLDSPSTSKISFVSTGKKIHRGEYVQINYSQGSLIGLVNDVIKRNRYFENTDSVKEFENSNIDISKFFPSDSWEFLEASVKPLGVLRDGRFIRSTLPVSPGDKVYLADTNILSKFLHLDPNGLLLGEIEHPSLKVKFNLNRLLQKHFAILAQSGAGKSYLTSVILEELLDRTPEQGRVATILIDTHGEYSSFSNVSEDPTKKDYSSKTIKINSKDIRIGCSGLSSGFFFSLLPNLTPAQRRELDLVLKKLEQDKRNGAGPYSLKEIIRELELSEKQDVTTKNLINSLISLDDYRLFGKIDQPSIMDSVEPGKLTVIDLSREISSKKKQIIVYYFAHKLFYGRMEGKAPPFLMVIEEAHQYAPEKAKKEYALAKNILETIAREGRKFGASVCLISQRPVRLSTTILSQANTHIILRVTNPNDLKHIEDSSEGLDSTSVGMITSLRVGEALVVGEASSSPVFFKVRKKKVQDSHLELSLSDLCKKFEDDKALLKRDIDSF